MIKFCRLMICGSKVEFHENPQKISHFSLHSPIFIYILSEIFNSWNGFFLKLWMQAKQRVSGHRVSEDMSSDSKLEYEELWLRRSIKDEDGSARSKSKRSQESGKSHKYVDVGEFWMQAELVFGGRRRIIVEIPENFKSAM